MLATVPFPDQPVPPLPARAARRGRALDVPHVHPSGAAEVRAAAGARAAGASRPRPRPCPRRQPTSGSNRSGSSLSIQSTPSSTRRATSSGPRRSPGSPCRSSSPSETACGCRRRRPSACSRSTVRGPISVCSAPTTCVSSSRPMRSVVEDARQRVARGRALVADRARQSRPARRPNRRRSRNGRTGSSMPSSKQKPTYCEPRGSRAAPPRACADRTT